MNPRLLLFAQWFFVLLYAKFGYYAKGNAEAHWARFFYLSNELVLIGWIYLCYKGRVNKYNDKVIRSAFWFNIFLLPIWGQFYIPVWHDIIMYSGVYIPLVSYFCLYMIITYLINFRKNK